jgi:sarcosine oxidase, subunit gamma
VANPAQRQGPLDHLGLAARAQTTGENGIQLTVLPVPHIVELRGTWSDAFASAVHQALGVKLPAASPDTAKSDGLTVFWMGPDRWWLVGDGAALPSVNELRQNLAAFNAAAVEVGDAFAAVEIAGPKSRDVLAKGCTLDLHPKVFRTGSVVQTNLAKAQIVLYQRDQLAYRVFARRSFAEYLWTWLEDAGMEYGVSIETV